MSLLEFTLHPYKKREYVDESTLSTLTNDSCKKSVEQVTSKSENQLETVPPPPNFEIRITNVFETIVELHLTICSPPNEVILRYKF